MVTKYESLPYEERLQKLGLTSHQERRERGDAIQAYKYIYSKDAHKFYVPSTITHTRGNSMKVEHPTASIHIRKHCFSRRSAKIWNQLPQSAATAKSVNEFKSEYDRGRIAIQELNEKKKFILKF